MQYDIEQLRKKYGVTPQSDTQYDIEALRAKYLNPQTSTQAFQQPETAFSKNIKQSTIASENAEYAKKAQQANSPLAYGAEISRNLPFIGGAVKVGETLGGALASKTTINQQSQADTQRSDIKLNLVKEINKLKSEGKDTSRLEQSYNMLEGGKLNIPTLPTNRQAVGQLGQLGLDVATIGVGSAGMQSGKLAVRGGASQAVASKLPSALSNVVPRASVAGVLPQGASQASKIKGLLTGSTAKAVGVGGSVGYGYDVSSNLQQGKEGGEAFTPGLGTALGVGIPLAIGGIQTAVNTSKKINNIRKGESEIPANIMQRVARISKQKQAKFKATSGESVGEYLVNRNIYGKEDEIVDQLVNRFKASKDEVDTALSTLQGDYKFDPIKTALDDLVSRESRISTPGAVSKDYQRINQLANKHDGVGLTMSEINEAKRLYERNVKLDFIKSQNTEGVARANNIDDAIRQWQFKKADELGFTNLKQLNKETRLAKQLADDLGNEISGSAGNNAISITDWILLAGGNPTTLAGFGLKKLVQAKGVRSSIAKSLSGNRQIKGLPKAEFRESGLPKAEITSAKQVQPQLSEIQSQISLPKSITLPKGSSIEDARTFVNKYIDDTMEAISDPDTFAVIESNPEVFYRQQIDDISAGLKEGGIKYKRLADSISSIDASKINDFETLASKIREKLNQKTLMETITGKGIPNRQGGFIKNPLAGESKTYYRGQVKSGDNLQQNMGGGMSELEGGKFFTVDKSLADKFGDNTVERIGNQKNTVTKRETIKLQEMATKQIEKDIAMQVESNQVLEDMALGKPKAFAEYTGKPIVEVQHLLGRQGGEVVYYEQFDNGIIKTKPPLAQSDNLVEAKNKANAYAKSLNEKYRGQFGKMTNNEIVTLQELNSAIDKLTPSKVIKTMPVKDSPLYKDVLSEQATKFKTPEEFIKSEKNKYVYHTTTDNGIDGIINEGLSKKNADIYPHGEFPEDNIGKMVYLADTAEATQSAGTFKTGNMLRLKKISLNPEKTIDRVKGNRTETRYWGSDISPAEIEILDNGNWKPLLEYADENGFLDDMKKNNESWSPASYKSNESQLEEIWKKANKSALPKGTK